jgi:hypothetical protein
MVALSLQPRLPDDAHRTSAAGHCAKSFTSAIPRLVEAVLRGDSQSPSNDPLSRCVPGVFLERERFAGLGNDFTPASPASIDAGMDRRFSGLVLLVELGTDADFYVMAPPEECHGSLSFA